VISPATHIGAVHLTTPDLNRAVRFYEQHLGFAVHRKAAHETTLGAPDGIDLLVLHESPTAPRVRGTTGLYHFAVLVPTRADLARALRRLVETDTRLQGVADHGVSESLYLADADGNGIEIYRDRPRREWPFVNGQLKMGADPLDLDRLIAESDARDTTPAADTIMGHVHLQVSDLDAARRFYVDVLGFTLTQRYGPSALFVAAGDYHHHLGLNTWAGVGIPAPPPGAVGLEQFIVQLPDRAALDAVVARLRAAAIRFEMRNDGVRVADPSANAILLRTQA
jgi:catechol 2,3-dioxygenase